MLALTKKTDYALIGLSELARQPDCLSSAREIAERHHVPLPLLTNILKNLAKAGIVCSERGASGGYRLARHPERINLHELITAIEGPFQFVRCAGDTSEVRVNCELETSCPIRLPAHRIRMRLKELLEHVTLAELVEGDSPRNGHSRPVALVTTPSRRATA